MQQFAVYAQNHQLPAPSTPQEQKRQFDMFLQQQVFDQQALQHQQQNASQQRQQNAPQQQQQPAPKQQNAPQQQTQASTSPAVQEQQFWFGTYGQIV
jgi:hypothetical protein